MSTPEEGSPGPRSNHPRYVFRYTCDGKGEAFAEGTARRRPLSAGVEADGEPKVEVAYDRSRHVIQEQKPGRGNRNRNRNRDAISSCLRLSHKLIASRFHSPPGLPDRLHLGPASSSSFS